MGKNSGKWAMGALAAGAIGYLAGVLTAPKSGKETRRDIMNAATKAKTEAEKRLKSLHSELSENLDSAKTKASKLKGKSKTELDKVIASASAVKEKVREILSALHEGDASDPELKKALDDAKEALDHLKKYAKS